MNRSCAGQFELTRPSWFRRDPIGEALLLHWKELKLLWVVVVLRLNCLLAVSPAAFRSGNCLGCLP